MSGLRSTSNVRLVLMLACGGGVGEQRARPRRPQAVLRSGLTQQLAGGLAPLRGGSGGTSLVDQASVRLVVGQPARAVEERKPAIWVFVHAHAHLDEVMPVALLGNLQHAVLVADRVVLPTTRSSWTHRMSASGPT